jgi:C-terminal processing protease CtpA/Prc
MFDVEDVPELGPSLVVKQVSDNLVCLCTLLFFAQLVKGGSAQMDGSIAAGDVVTQIDSVHFSSSVCSSSDSALASVKEVTSGVCGSTLRLHILRPNDGSKFEVNLTRGNAQ